MKYDLKTPCKHCPFRTDKTAIRFACRERAEEIEESAYRNGFPCHKSAENVEADEEGEGGGYMATEDSQHCVGYVIMKLKEGEYAWPGVDNDEDLVDRLAGRVNMKAPVFEDSDAFFAANESN